MSISLLGELLGGIGLFLLGMWLMTDGLKIAAGAALRDLLGRWTRTRWRGLAAGFGVTAVVQSSSAVTVAIIGFVNAGLLDLSHAVWVLFGANVGTSMTGWLVALIGFQIKVEAFALPLIGVGAFLRLVGDNVRRKALGEALAGFGLFFLGIAILKQGFTGVGTGLDPASLITGGWGDHAVFLGIGIALTLLTQSSSASIALALTATAGGLLPLDLGAVMVIGANVGTTSTGILSVIGATSNAKRVAVSHLLFNLVAACFAFALLPWVVDASALLSDALGLAETPVTVLAIFHTVFNVLGVALMWPLADRVTAWLGRRFVSREEDAARPRFLDANSLAVPNLAIEGVRNELWRLQGMVTALALDVLGERAPAPHAVARGGAGIHGLIAAINGFVSRLGAQRLAGEETAHVTHGLRALQHMEFLAELMPSLARHRARLGGMSGEARQALEVQRTLVRAGLEAVAVPGSATPVESIEAALRANERRYQETKNELLAAGTHGGLAVEVLSEAMAFADEMRRTAERNLKGMLRLAAMAGHDDAKRASPDNEVADEPPPSPNAGSPGG